jgi:cytidine deaminase
MSTLLSTPTRRDLLLAAASTTVALASDQPAKLQSILNNQQFSGRIDAAQVDALLSAENLTREQFMLRLLPLAKRRAHAPLSHYLVGAVALGNSGSLYLGQNIEIPNNMLGLAVHGEQSAIANAYMADETGIKAIAVTAAPCGHCRQFLSEVSLEMLILMPDLPALPLSELLPRAFGPKNLGMAQGAFPRIHKQIPLNTNVKDEVLLAAWKAACGAYSPYTNSPSGAAFATSSGRIFAGSYIENAAFNPSLPPLETALAAYFAAGPAAGEIQRAVLVESPGATISHLLTTQSVLTAIAPGAKFDRVLLSSAAKPVK